LGVWGEKGKDKHLAASKLGIPHRQSEFNSRGRGGKMMICSRKPRFEEWGEDWGGGGEVRSGS